MKKILIKKLNRTVLGKEGTNWCYLSCKEFSLLFNITSEELERKGEVFYKFYLKQQFLLNNFIKPYDLYLTYANGREFRLQGGVFSELYEKLNVCECDSLCIESAEYNGENVYLIDVIKDKNIIMKSYTKSDIENKDEINPEYMGLWWFWDNNLNEDEYLDFINNYHIVTFVHDKMIEKKIIRLTKISKFDKYVSKQAGFTQKILFRIEELINTEWKNADFNSIKAIEFEENYYGYKLSKKDYRPSTVLYEEID